MSYFKAICIVSLLTARISTLPITIKSDSSYIKPLTITDLPNVSVVTGSIDKTVIPDVKPNDNEVVNTTKFNTEIAINNATARNSIRPGMTVIDYAVNIVPDIASGTFSGTTIVRLSIASGTEEEEIQFYAKDLNINSVRYAIRNGDIYFDADFNIDDDEGILFIMTGRDDVRTYTFVIEYTGSLGPMGIYLGNYNSNMENYIAMNLHPTHARRVFPCIDEPSQITTISFTFENFPYTFIVTNSLLEENSQTEFRGLQGPPHSWGMIAHNFNNINIPSSRVLLFGRQGVFSQDIIASAAISFYFNNLNEWTNKPYFEILNDQNENLHIFALPDVSKDWLALSSICIWEPYILMENTHSVKQRKDAIVAIAEGLVGQWYGYVVFPENWRYEWIITGLRKHIAYEMVRLFQTPAVDGEDSVIDMDTIFATDIIQQSLLEDSYTNAPILEPSDDIFDEHEILLHVNGLLKYKAPALLWMLKSVLAGHSEQDFIQTGAQGLLNTWSLEPATSSDFYDGINGGWQGNEFIGNIRKFMEPFLTQNGYPLIHVSLRQGGVVVTQERFGFSDKVQVLYDIPITYSISTNPNFESTVPVTIMSTTYILNNMFFDEEDYVLFNVRGQGYYRVDYDSQLWERIIEALQDPDRRQEIHPMNRATLVDDALNIARAGKLDYDIAFRVVLSMEHETDYAVWKAFVRNMKFLQKRLVAHVTLDEELDPDIYLRMVRRTIIAFENEIGFYPDVLSTYPAMTSLTRGLVMDHACRANYQPCIAAAIDWFYDPNSAEPTVNPDIPHEIRPAVYCTMVREGDDEVISALYRRLEIEPTMYERVVILESLGCSRDSNFITTLLQETIAANSQYTTEEKMRIFAAVADSSFENAGLAINFIYQRTNEIRQMYGGDENLEKLIFMLAENMAEPGLASEFERYVNSGISNLGDSKLAADEAQARVFEDLQWNFNLMDYVYEWIDENDAPTLMGSITLLSLISALHVVLNL